MSMQQHLLSIGCQLLRMLCDHSMVVQAPAAHPSEASCSTSAVRRVSILKSSFISMAAGCVQVPREAQEAHLREDHPL